MLVLLHLGQLREPHHDGLAAQCRELLGGAGAEHIGIAERSEAARIAVEVEVAHASAGVQRQQRLHLGAALRRDGVRVRTVEQLAHALRNVGMAAQEVADKQAVRLQRLPVAQRLRLQRQQLGIARARTRQQASEIGVGVRQQGMNGEGRQAGARCVGAAEGREGVDAAEHAGGQREGRRPERRRVDRGAQVARRGEEILARTRLADVGPRHQIEAARHQNVAGSGDLSRQGAILRLVDAAVIGGHARARPEGDVQHHQPRAGGVDCLQHPFVHAARPARRKMRRRHLLVRRRDAAHPQIAATPVGSGIARQRDALGGAAVDADQREIRGRALRAAQPEQRPQVEAFLQCPQRGQDGQDAAGGTEDHTGCHPVLQSGPALLEPLAPAWAATR